MSRTCRGRVEDRSAIAGKPTSTSSRQTVDVDVDACCPRQEKLQNFDPVETATGHVESLSRPPGCRRGTVEKLSRAAYHPSRSCRRFRGGAGNLSGLPRTGSRVEGPVEELSRPCGEAVEELPRSCREPRQKWLPTASRQLPGRRSTSTGRHIGTQKEGKGRKRNLSGHPVFASVVVIPQRRAQNEACRRICA